MYRFELAQPPLPSGDEGSQGGRVHLAQLKDAPQRVEVGGFGGRIGSRERLLVLVPLGSRSELLDNFDPSQKVSTGRGRHARRGAAPTPPPCCCGNHYYHHHHWSRAKAEKACGDDVITPDRRIVW